MQKFSQSLKFENEGKFKINETPVAKYVSENILTLPLYADLSLEEVDKICKIIKSMKK